MKGVRLIDFQSLLDYINSMAEPAYVSANPQTDSSEEISGKPIVQEIGSGQKARITVSVEVAD